MLARVGLRSSIEAARSRACASRAAILLPVRPRWCWLIHFLVLVFLIHVLDVMLQDEEVRLRRSIYFNRVLIVPVNDSLDRFAVLQNDDHRSLVLHLLHVIKIFSVGLIVWRRPPCSRLTYCQLFFNLGKARPNQFSI